MQLAHLLVGLVGRNMKTLDHLLHSWFQLNIETEDAVFGRDEPVCL